VRGISTLYEWEDPGGKKVWKYETESGLQKLYPELFDLKQVENKPVLPIHQMAAGNHLYRYRNNSAPYYYHVASPEIPLLYFLNAKDYAQINQPRPFEKRRVSKEMQHNVI
jgi:hypothetical protein